MGAQHGRRVHAGGLIRHQDRRDRDGGPDPEQGGHCCADEAFLKTRRTSPGASRATGPMVTIPPPAPPAPAAPLAPYARSEQRRHTRFRPCRPARRAAPAWAESEDRGHDRAAIGDAAAADRARGVPLAGRARGNAGPGVDLRKSDRRRSASLRPPGFPGGNAAQSRWLACSRAAYRGGWWWARRPSERGRCRAHQTDGHREGGHETKAHPCAPSVGDRATLPAAVA